MVLQWHQIKPEVFGVEEATNSPVIDNVTFGSGGTAVNFGSLSQGRRGASACSSATRSVFAGGVASPDPTYVSTMDYITIADRWNCTRLDR